MALLSVAEALARVLASITAPVDADELPLAACAGRTLARDLAARRTQPPFAASAMDGYAVRAADLETVPRALTVIGTSVAGHGFDGSVAPRTAVRIFTGAPVPDGADAIVIQEDTHRNGDDVTVLEAPVRGRFIRPRGLDFLAGDVLLPAGRRLNASALSLAAAMGHAGLAVRRKPRVAILPTGDELVQPGEPVGPDQIVASNSFGVAALVARAGGEPINLGIVRDRLDDLRRAIGWAKDAGADLLITLGGASVGDHDLVQEALTEAGMELGFWRVALRPGKPLMHGRLGSMLLLGLPGNPVSSLVCAVLFAVPAIHALLGQPGAAEDLTEPAILGVDLPANDQRQDYLRAALYAAPEGWPVATPQARQDSSMLAVLARSEALLVRPPHAPPAKAGDPCRIIRLDRFS
jgi:molybdopterin molybdotransferase